MNTSDNQARSVLRLSLILKALCPTHSLPLQTTQLKLGLGVLQHALKPANEQRNIRKFRQVNVVSGGSGGDMSTVRCQACH